MITQSTVWYFRNFECEVTAANGLDSKKQYINHLHWQTEIHALYTFIFVCRLCLFICLFLFRKIIDGIINVSIARTTDYNKNNALIICTRVWIHPISKILPRQIVNPLIILHDYKINVQCFDNGIFFIKQILIKNTLFCSIFTQFYTRKCTQGVYFHICTIGPFSKR